MALAGAIALLDLALSVTLVGLLSVAPLVTCLRSTARSTSCVGVLAVLLALLVGLPDEIFGSADHLGRVLVVAIAAILAVRLAALHERSERAEGEARLVTDGVQDYAIFVLDPEGTILQWNGGAARIYGYQPEDVIGETFSVLHGHESRNEGRWKQMLDMADEDGWYEEEDWRTRRNGTRFMAHVSISKLRDRHGALRGYSNITRDISDRWAAEQEGKRHDQRASFLAEAGVLLESSLDYEATLRHIARLAVPRLADWAFVESCRTMGRSSGSRWPTVTPPRRHWSASTTGGIRSSSTPRRDRPRSSVPACRSSWRRSRRRCSRRWPRIPSTYESFATWASDRRWSFRCARAGAPWGAWPLSQRNLRAFTAKAILR